MSSPAAGLSNRRRHHLLGGAAFSTVMVWFAYQWAGWLIAMVFSAGFVTGWLMWLVRPATPTFSSIKAPYFVALGAYVIHRIDEEVSGFVPAIEELTGAEPVALTSPLSLGIAGLSVMWMLSPVLLRWRYPLGAYGAWTLFAGFGVLELAHFVFPLLTPGGYGYFPGMVTAPLIIAAGWWGLLRLWRLTEPQVQTVASNIAR